ncbi:MAG TPA: glycosyltransferase, partial [Paraburkholderia sp.]
MFRRAWNIAVAHGPRVFLQRAGAWLDRRARARDAAAARARALRDAWDLPTQPISVAFPASDEPLVTIVVPVFNRWRYTNACLRALAANADAAIPTEVVVVDDGSTDATSELLAACTGIRTVRTAHNGGFAAACNAGAAVARGTYLHFLNNDTVVADGWLQPLIDAFAGDPSTGAVVSQLRYPDDTLAEAGGVLWRDGRGSNYGRGNAPTDWRYATARDVDYGSAASLMVRADAFAAAGGFSTAYAPAYYEDADLCFALRAAGFRTRYAPGSVVYHAEGISFGSNASDAARALQERNRATFAQKWGEELRGHFEPNAADADRAARRRMGTKTMLVVDAHVPFADRDAGSRRIRFVIDVLRARGWHTIFGSIDSDEYGTYTAELRTSGIDVIAGFGAASLAMLKQNNVAVDAAWLCRPEPAALLPAVRDAFDAKIIFDTVDLHFRRLEREEAIRGRPTGWAVMRERELGIARSADLTIAVSDDERDVLAAYGIAPLAVVPVIEPVPARAAPDWASRDGVVFLGNYAHAPNVDGVAWLCEAIMPLVWQRLPGLRVTLAGADPTRAVRALASANVDVIGYVKDTAPLLDAARVFAAPLRFGAGVKGKIVHALAHGIPVVTTPIGAEGIFDAGENGAV